MAACPSCGSFLVGGTACEFCSRYGVPAAQPAPWQPPTINTGISLLELMWARTRVRWASVLIGAIGGLSICAYWLITRHPDTLGQLALGLLLDPDKVGADSRTTFDILELIAIFVLSWIPLTGVVVHVVSSGPSSMLSTLAKAADVTPLLWQGCLYLVLAVLVWRRSMVGLSQKFVDMSQNYPSLVSSNPYDLQHWPWLLVLPILIRGALLWFLAMTFSGMGIVRLHHRRLKAARADEAAQAQAA